MKEEAPDVGTTYPFTKQVLLELPDISGLNEEEK